MARKYIEIVIDGFDVTIEGHGFKGVSCETLAKFLTNVSGGTKVAVTHKDEHGQKIPTEVSI